MLNVVIVGGSSVDAIVNSLDTQKYNITKKHKFVSDAFEDVMINYTEYIDVDVIVVLQHGIKDDENRAQQMRSMQEVMDVSGITSRLYFMLNDTSLYSELEAEEEPIVYKFGRILYFQKLYNKNVMEVIEGKYDNSGISFPEEEVEEEYVEEGLEQDEDEDLSDLFKENRPEMEKIEDEHESIKDLRKKKKPADRLGILKKKSEEEPIGNVSNNVARSGFTGVLAVTGDRNSGVSTTASSMAETFAKSGRTVLLIDFDFKRRFQSIIYPEFEEYENAQPRTQMGVYYALSNPNVLEDVRVIVKDNLALLGLNRGASYYKSPIVDRTLEELEDHTRINNLIGVAKSLYDVVIIDFPLEQVFRLIETSIIIDKFILCVDNNVNSFDTLFNVTFAEAMGTHELFVKSILYRSFVVLTRYSTHAKYGRKELDTKIAQELLQEAVYNKMTVAGKVTYSNVFQNIGNTAKNVIDLYDVTRSEFIDICENIKI